MSDRIESALRKIDRDGDFYSKHYRDGTFWKKVGKLSEKFCARHVLEKVLALYYCMKDPFTPFGVKARITIALGYLIFPIDVIPDMIPVLGYTDDIAVICFIYNEVEANVKAHHIQKAYKKLG